MTKPTPIALAFSLVLASCVVGEVGPEASEPPLESLDEVELEWVRDGDMLIPKRADGRALVLAAGAPRRQVVYLNFDGATITHDSSPTNNAQNNTSPIVANGVATIPAFDASPWGERNLVISRIFDGVEEDFDGFDVAFTMRRPQGPHTMFVIGGAPEHIGIADAAGIAPYDAGNLNENDVGFVFPTTLAGIVDERHVAWVISHELGHALGLHHLPATNAIMHRRLMRGDLVWSEGTNEKGVFQNDRAVLASVLSASEDPAPPTPEPTPPLPCGVLGAGQGVSGNQYLPSCDNRFFMMVTNGSVGVYHNGYVLWHTGTYSSGGALATMQSDGNFVLYNGAGGAVWASWTHGNPGAYLAMQNDGNLVVYSANNVPLWQSGTGGH